jgi:hypothetical protein
VDYLKVIAQAIALRLKVAETVLSASRNDSESVKKFAEISL